MRIGQALEEHLAQLESFQRDALSQDQPYALAIRASSCRWTCRFQAPCHVQIYPMRLHTSTNHDILVLGPNRFTGLMTNALHSSRFSTWSDVNWVRISSPSPSSNLGGYSGIKATRRILRRRRRLLWHIFVRRAVRGVWTPPVLLLHCCLMDTKARHYPSGSERK